MPIKSNCALILPGAVAKGAFEAGVIDVLTRHHVQIDRIVATSSGALNGVALAAGIRSGHTREMAEKLATAWIEGGGWGQSLSLSPLDWLRRRGFSGNQGLLKMLRELVKPCTNTLKKEVELRIIATPLNGVKAKIGNVEATTYEKVFHFSGKDFDTTEGLERVFEVTTAACAFSGLYAPVEIEGLGPCVDGGAVNNAPIEYALDEGDVNQILMPIPFPALATKTPDLHGLSLANQLVEILVNERLFRDLRNAELVNKDILNLENLKTSGVLSAEQLEQVKAAIKIRTVKIMQIRPAKTLPGSSFSGFFSKQERLMLIEEGRKAAIESLTDSDATDMPIKESATP